MHMIVKEPWKKVNIRKMLLGYEHFRKNFQVSHSDEDADYKNFLTDFLNEKIEDHRTLP